MKILKHIIWLALSLAPLLGFAQRGGVGQWRDQYSYSDVLQIVVLGNEICGVTENGLFYYDRRDNSLRRKTNVQGLSEVGLTASSYDPSSQTQIVGYESGNIDLIQNGRVFNIPHVRRAQISGSKRINKIVIENSQRAYLCCDFGIVVLNLLRREITATYFIGPNNSNVQVNDLALIDSSIYVATNIGLLRADRFSNKLNDFSEWREEPVDSRTGRSFQDVYFWNEHLIVSQSHPNSMDTIWRYAQGVWHVLNVGFGTQLKVSRNRLFQFRRIDGEAYLYQIREYDVHFGILHEHSGDGDFVWWGLRDIEVDSENNLWISTGYGGLTLLSSGWNVQGNILPRGPANNRVYALTHSPTTLYSANGSVHASLWAPGMLDFGVNILRDGHWKTFDYQSIQSSRWLADAVAVAEDPKDPNVFVVASFQSGVVQSNADGSVTIYNDENSTFEWTYWNNEKHSIRCGDVKFDSKNQLWVTNVYAENAHAENSLHKRTQTPFGEEWRAYNLSHVITTGPKEFIIDYYDQLWIRTRWGGLVFFREANNSAGFEALAANLNRGNNQGVSVLNCLVEDHKGYVWLGTDRGILVNYTSRQLFNNPNGMESTVVFETVICEGRPLLENEVVTAIAVDGADRKWMGTSSSGVFLMSADGKDMIRQFNTENSPLNSNTITALAINPITGDVFVGTDKGLMSYSGDATQGSRTSQPVVVFPNPVQPDFTGEIGIRGLVENARVHITDVSGRLIYETFAKGGMAVWDGRTRNGQRVLPGVYVVFSTNADGTEGAVGRIFFNR